VAAALRKGSVKGRAVIEVPAEPNHWHTHAGFVAAAAAAVWFRVWEPFESFSLIGALGS
jgi:hypothetical protein